MTQRFRVTEKGRQYRDDLGDLLEKAKTEGLVTADEYWHCRYGDPEEPRCVHIIVTALIKLGLVERVGTREGDG